jgi:hypothetical protein
MTFLIYLLAVTGLVILTNKSKLLKSFREGITANYISADEVYIFNKESKLKRNVLWFLNSIFNCSMCMSPWAGVFVLGLYGLSIYILYPLAAVAVTTLLITLYEKL